MNEYDLLNAIKQTALEAVETKKPVRIEVGTVISKNPLKIQIGQKIVLSAMQLVIPQHLTNHKVQIKYNFDCKEESEHKHDIEGTTEITINNALKQGDKVLLFRQDGGQKYIVFDKVVDK